MQYTPDSDNLVPHVNATSVGSTNGLCISSNAILLKLLESLNGYTFLLSPKNFHHLQVSQQLLNNLLITARTTRASAKLHGLHGPAGPLPPASHPTAGAAQQSAGGLNAFPFPHASMCWKQSAGVGKGMEEQGWAGASLTKKGVGRRYSTRLQRSCHNAVMHPESVLDFGEIGLAGPGM